MYTSIFAVLALAASTLAAPAPIERRQGAVTCGSTVSVSIHGILFTPHIFFSEKTKNPNPSQHQYSLLST
jgi:hypothetical protein